MKAWLLLQLLPRDSRPAIAGKTRRRVQGAARIAWGPGKTAHWASLSVYFACAAADMASIAGGAGAKRTHRRWQHERARNVCAQCVHASVEHTEMAFMML